MSALDPTIISSLSVLAGVIVGLGAPFANARFVRTASSRSDERATAERLLDVWQDEPDVLGALRNETSKGRRSLLLLGLRLSDERARISCLQLINVASSDASDHAVLDAWTDMIEAVAHAYRSTS